MRLVDTILTELEREAQTTRRLLERVPEDKLGWKPHPKSMSMGELAFHIASIPGNISRLASVDTFEVGAFPTPEAKSRQELVTTLDQSLGQARDILGDMDDERLLATWNATREGKTLMSLPRIGVLRNIMLNHWYHHRGQLGVYLRMHDVPLPSVYGPTADENPFAM